MDLAFLEGLDRRMQFVAVVEAIVRRSGRDMDLERLFEPQELDSVILAVLVFIMEETLAENRECTLDNIEQFLASLLDQYKSGFPADRLHDLADYIVKVVLKNDGEPRYYTLLNPAKGFQRMRVDFLSDKQQEMGSSYRITYQLTDQAYEFLFRTKEVENELRFTLEELKLRELIRRKNYKKAVRQSAGLTQMIRQKKRELQQFQDRIRDNILTVDVGEYENLIKGTFELLNEEYGMMQEIRGMLRLAYEHLKEEERLQGALDADMLKAMSEMEQIRHNLDIAVSEQRGMILERHSISDVYAGIMKEAFARRLMNRFDFEDEILKPMERLNEAQMPSVNKLLNPLFMPEFKKWASIASFYQPQAKLKQQEERPEGIETENLTEDEEARAAQNRNTLHIALIEQLLYFSSTHQDGFRLSAFIQHLQQSGGFPDQQTGQATLFQAMLRLYEAGIVDILRWKTEKPEVVDNASGEFDLEYCLYHVQFEHADLFGIDRIRMEKPDESVYEAVVRMETNGAVFESKITISDFAFHVEGGAP